MRKAFLNIVRVNGDEGTPVPIPNTVVKLIYGDNTWLATAREDNSTRTSKQQLRLLLFFYFSTKNNSVWDFEFFKFSLFAGKGGISYFSYGIIKMLDSYYCV